MDFRCSLDSKESTCNAGDLDSIPGWGRSPGEGNRLPTPVFWPGESHGQSSLAGYSLWGHKESDTMEWLTLSFSPYCQTTDIYFLTDLEATCLPGAGRVGSFWRFWVGSVPCPSPSFCCLPAILGIPWFLDVSISVCLHQGMAFFLHVSVQIF